jgi:hypothetical protein
VRLPASKSPMGCPIGSKRALRGPGRNAITGPRDTVGCAAKLRGEAEFGNAYQLSSDALEARTWYWSAGSAGAFSEGVAVVCDEGNTQMVPSALPLYGKGDGHPLFHRGGLRQSRSVPGGHLPGAESREPPGRLRPRLVRQEGWPPHRLRACTGATLLGQILLHFANQTPGLQPVAPTEP